MKIDKDRFEGAKSNADGRILRNRWILFLFQEEPMVLLMGKVFFQKVCDPVMNLSNLLVGEAVP